MERPGSTLVDGRLASDFINATEVPLHESPTDFVGSLDTSVPEISFVKSDDDRLLPGNQDFSRLSEEGGQAVTALAGQDDAQLELAVEDDGVVEDGEEDLGPEGHIRVDEDDQAFIYVNSSRPAIQTFDDGLLPAGNLIYSRTEDQSQEASQMENKEMEVQTVATSVMNAVPPDNAMLQPPVLASTPSSSADENSTLGSYPLGSSKNPIRIIQQGNKYTSMQQLTSEQLSQIMQVCKLALLGNSDFISDGHSGMGAALICNQSIDLHIYLEEP
jgi:hypothetical protein